MILISRFERYCVPLRAAASLPWLGASLQHLYFCSAVANWSTQARASFSHRFDVIDEFTRYCHQRNLPKAMLALETMQKHKIWADPFTYQELIKYCIAQRAVREGKIVHRHVSSIDYEPVIFLMNTLLHMYVKFNLLDEAQEVFDQMQERNFVTWTTIIAAYSSTRFKDKALEMLVLMLRDGVKPNMYTYSSVLRACTRLSNLTQLHCCIIKVGLELDVFVRSALIDIYSGLGKLHLALEIFNEMATKDIVVWSSIVAGFAQNSDGDQALKFYLRMIRAGLRANQSILTSVLRACTSLTLLELGRQVHVHVIKFGQDVILENALLDMYCKCGGLNDANSTFNEMIQKDVISWSTMIVGFAQNGYSQRALDMFQLMKDSGTKPNYITIVGVLYACSHAGLVEEGEYYFRSMKALFGIDPGREHYNCMVDLLARAGKFNEAVKLISDMKCLPDEVTWRSLLGPCRVHRNMALAEYAAKQILKLDPRDQGAYILLSNIYAKTQRWEDVRNLRSSMKARGIKKEPGCSWIEINKQIHTFIVGDVSHPDMNAVYGYLNQIILRLKEVGYVPDASFVLQDLEEEQMENSLQYHSEKLAIVFGLMRLPKEKTLRIAKNLKICGDCHVFTKLLTKMENRKIVIRDLSRYHHFQDGVCSCGDYW